MPIERGPREFSNELTVRNSLVAAAALRRPIIIRASGAVNAIHVYREGGVVQLQFSNGVSGSRAVIAPLPRGYIMALEMRSLGPGIRTRGLYTYTCMRE